jgi:hypothetical protein
MPMINSIETNLAIIDYEEKFVENFSKYEYNINLDNFNLINIKLQLLNFFKILIFLELGFAIGHTIRCAFDGDLSNLFMDFLFGLLFFPVSIVGIYNRITNTGDYLEAIQIILLYIIGAIILLFIENFNPNFINYFIGFLLFGIIYIYWLENFIID